jgi:hypothetical protein
MSPVTGVRRWLRLAFSGAGPGCFSLFAAAAVLQVFRELVEVGVRVPDDARLAQLREGRSVGGTHREKEWQFDVLDDPVRPLLAWSVMAQ